VFDIVVRNGNSHPGVLPSIATVIEPSIATVIENDSKFK